MPAIDFVAHARSLGAQAEKVARLRDLPAALERARAGMWAGGFERPEEWRRRAGR
jgi:TPP-dependent trihydroxycyclohexane-1,2-dione (THcHDO) dehydratase